MSKLTQMVAAGLMAAFALTSIYSLAAAEPAAGADAASLSCEKTICLFALF